MTEIRKRPRFTETIATVREVIQETPDARSLRLELEEGFDWKVGQFVMTKPVVGGRLIPRAYSISSSPTRRDKYLQLTVRETREPTVSAYMNERQVGDEFKLRGPYGEFYWTEGQTDTIFMVGGGSGITPLHAILEYVHDKKLDVPLTLLYSATTRENIILREPLERLAAQTPSATLHITLTREDPDGWEGGTGRYTSEVVGKFIKGYEKGGFFLCGAPPFVKGIRDLLEGLGIPPEAIKQERWS